jgi:hypothetical protein
MALVAGAGAAGAAAATGAGAGGGMGAGAGTRGAVLQPASTGAISQRAVRSKRSTMGTVASSPQ